MATLRKDHIKQSRKTYVCDDCAKSIPAGSSYWYLYGMAEVNDKPYPLRFCESCEAEYQRMLSAPADTEAA